jgi:protoporphyrinogen oxidase
MYMSVSTVERQVVIIGAGPAGLTAGYLLSKQGISVAVLEADPSYVGGIARTVQYKGYRFDIGGHRFFSKSKEIEELWTELLPDGMLRRPRSSRIYFDGKFYPYPLRPVETLLKLGPLRTAFCVASYLKARLRPIPSPRNFEDWVTNEFGRRLYEIFFKTYTEKVWGMSCREISADWAAQRIKGLSLTTAVLNALRPRNMRKDAQVIKTLIDSFRYPRLGPGMMWEACADRIAQRGGSIIMGARATACAFDSQTSTWSVTYQRYGREETISACHVISSAAIRDLIPGLRPHVSAKALSAANMLKYRDFLTVVLILRERGAFDDNWIYIHDPNVKVGRIQNFKSWSPEMVPDPNTVCYGLEYFCFEGDGLWESKDSDLIALAAEELARIGLARQEDVLDGCVVRQPKAYPVYDDNYSGCVATVRAELARDFPNLHLIGRNGMHKYNNQDHAMMTAMLCVRNIVAGRELYDLWQVNQDAEYHEAGQAGSISGVGDRMVPGSVKQR